MRFTRMLFGACLIAIVMTAIASAQSVERAPSRQGWVRVSDVGVSFDLPANSGPENHSLRISERHHTVPYLSDLYGMELFRKTLGDCRSGLSEPAWARTYEQYRDWVKRCYPNAVPVLKVVDPSHIVTGKMLFQTNGYKKGWSSESVVVLVYEENVGGHKRYIPLRRIMWRWDYEKRSDVAFRNYYLVVAGSRCINPYPTVCDTEDIIPAPYRVEKEVTEIEQWYERIVPEKVPCPVPAPQQPCVVYQPYFQPTLFANAPSAVMQGAPLQVRVTPLTDTWFTLYRRSSITVNNQNINNNNNTINCNHENECPGGPPNLPPGTTPPGETPPGTPPNNPPVPGGPGSGNTDINPPSLPGDGIIRPPDRP